LHRSLHAVAEQPLTPAQGCESTWTLTPFLCLLITLQNGLLNIILKSTSRVQGSQNGNFHQDDYIVAISIACFDNPG
jgi:hypothetical protein